MGQTQEQGAEIIDFTAEWMHRSICTAMDAGDWERAQIESALLEGYLDGMWSVRFHRGEPIFDLPESAPVEGSLEGPVV